MGSCAQVAAVMSRRARILFFNLGNLETLNPASWCIEYRGRYIRCRNPRGSGGRGMSRRAAARSSHGEVGDDHKPLQP